MSVHRVATNAAKGRLELDMARNLGRLTDVQDQIAGGKRLRKPSDNPTDVRTALNERAALRRTEQYATNLTDALGWSRVTDDVVVTSHDRMSAAAERMVQAKNGSLSAGAREGIALDIEGIKADLLQMANTKYLGRSIFGGTTAMAASAYDATGAYIGDTGAVNRTIEDGVSVQINVVGTDLFGTRDIVDPLKGDAFQILDEMAAAARSGDPAKMTAAMDAMQVALNRVTANEAKVGGMSNRIQSTLDRNAMMQIDVTERLSKVEDTDLAEAIISYKSHEAAYEASLSVTAKLIQPSLLNFLR